MQDATSRDGDVIERLSRYAEREQSEMRKWNEAKEADHSAAQDREYAVADAYERVLNPMVDYVNQHIETKTSALSRGSGHKTKYDSDGLAPTWTYRYGTYVYPNTLPYRCDKFPPNVLGTLIWVVEYGHPADRAYKRFIVSARADKSLSVTAVDKIGGNTEPTSAELLADSEAWLVKHIDNVADGELAAEVVADAIINGLLDVLEDEEARNAKLA